MTNDVIASSKIVQNFVDLIFEYFDMENTYIDILMLGKFNPFSQLREHDAKIQITHAEHYRESDNLFFEQVLLNNAYQQSINTKNDLLIKYVKYS